MVNKEAFAKRLQELMDYHEISAASLADKISVQRSSISHLLSGRNNPSLDFILKVLDNYPQISFEWLVKGIGSLESDVDTKDDSSSTPTLFEQEPIDSLQKTSKDVPETGYSKKTLLKTLLLYSDGSFEVFDKK